MAQGTSDALLDIVQRHEEELLRDWVQNQISTAEFRRDRIGEEELRRQSRDFLSAFREAVRSGTNVDLTVPQWSGLRDVLTAIAQHRAKMGFTPSETTGFLLSIKQPLFTQLRQRLAKDGSALAEQTWNITILLDKLALMTTEISHKSREEIIIRQQQELLELSTPVVRLWEGILALPLIGTLDSARTQVVMQNLLQSIVDTGARIAIIDITGVPTVDTLVAQHLLKTVAAARLMGADCIISGIRPQIAQTIIHLGVDLGGVVTKATLADAFALALQKLKLTITKVQA